LDLLYGVELKIIHIENFNAVDDPVKTEETINQQLLEKQNEINTDYVYISYPIAWNINNRGIGHTQNTIDQVCKKYHDKKLFFVCQHILVNRLDFRGNLVFTPHATVLDSYIPIPHHSCNFDLSKSKPWKDREYIFSFMGSFRTHPVRRKLYEYLKRREGCYVIDTGSWHFEKQKNSQVDNRQKYIELLGNTKYSLCPRGTGPSTIRIWESMAMNSCPVILSDLLQMPLEMWIERNLWVKMRENFEHIDIKDIKQKYNNSEYWEKFSNDNLYKSIEKFVSKGSW